MQGEDRKVKVFIFDDHDSVRESYMRWLEFEGFKVVGGQKSLEGCTEILQQQAPDVVLLDIDYPGHEYAGIQAAKRITRELPEVHVVFSSHFSEPEIVAHAMGAGAVGYFCKSDELRFLKEVILKASEGRFGLSPTATKNLVSMLRTEKKLPRVAGREFYLSPQESRVLGLIAGGFSNKEIARELGTNEKRIKNIISALLAKMGARNRAHAVTIGVRHGLVDTAKV
ncbi:MAG: response regulator transcription factor [candidate division KSB1 bacterium]|nr:response regulator transcription factor [candidate division KSB1 bacterium]